MQVGDKVVLLEYDPDLNRIVETDEGVVIKMDWLESDLMMVTVDSGGRVYETNYCNLRVLEGTGFAPMGAEVQYAEEKAR